MNADDYCKNKAASSGSSFYYSFRFLPTSKRLAIIALYAFCREVDDVVDECSDPGVARLKLGWWREEVDRIFSGSAQHLVGQALQPHVSHYNLPREYFMEIIDGMEMDLDKVRYNSFNELALYCYRAAGVVGLLTAEIFGYENRKTLDYATNLGTALQLTNILRDVREDAARGRIYIPKDEMERFGVNEYAIFGYQHTDAFRELMRFQAQRTRDYYKKAFSKLPIEDRHRQRSGIIMADIYEATLDEIEADEFRVLQHRVCLTPLRKLWIAWRTLRRENRLSRKYLKANVANNAQ